MSHPVSFVMNTFVKKILRKSLRQGIRPLLGPTFFDAVVHFGCMPAFTNLREKALGARCVFIEPHFDDVAFSCGGLLSELSQAGTDIDLVTVFTEGPSSGEQLSPERLSPLARDIHEGWGAAINPYQTRKREAMDAIASLGARSHWLGLQEALYREPALTSPEELLELEGDPQEDSSFQDVTEALKEFLEKTLGKLESPPSSPSVLLFAPLGVGGHRDHSLVHRAVRDLPLKRQGIATWYYEDFPYTLDIDALKRRVRQLGGRWEPTTVDVRSSIEARASLSARYATQVGAIFESQENLEESIRSYASFVGTPDQPRERFWKEGSS